MSWWQIELAYCAGLTVFIVAVRRRVERGEWRK